MGAASPVRMGARGASLIGASVRDRGNKEQFRRPLPSDRHGNLRTETRCIAAERTDGISDRAARRNEHVHQEATAIRSRKNVLHKQTTDALAGIAIRQVEV